MKRFVAVVEHDGGHEAKDQGDDDDGSERVVANHLGIILEGGWIGYNCPR